MKNLKCEEQNQKIKEIPLKISFLVFEKTVTNFKQIV